MKMKYSIVLQLLAAFVACILICVASGQDRSSSTVPASGGNIAQDPLDHISYIESQRQGWEQTYYPYFGPVFFEDYIPNRYAPGTYTSPYVSLYVSPNQPDPFYIGPSDSEFRSSSLSAMNWQEFRKNWTETISYLNSSSSLKIYRNGAWMTPKEAAALA